MSPRPIAMLALARSELDRASRLVEFDGVSKSEIDRLQARERAASAALAAAQARVNTRSLDVRIHHCSRADDRPDFRSPGRSRKSGFGRRRRFGHLAHHAQGDRSDLFRASTAPKRCSSRPSAMARPKACRSQCGCRTKAITSISGKLDFTDNGLDPQFRHDPRARRVRQSRSVPDPRHVRQHAPCDRRHGQGAAGARYRGADRPGAQGAAGRRARTARSRPSRSSSGR